MRNLNQIITEVQPNVDAWPSRTVCMCVCVCVCVCWLQPDYVKIAQYCNIWRNFDDIDDSWDSVNGIITFYGDDKTGFAEVAAPGSFNDPDMVSS